ncbi:toxin-activating lysine-acyltransferase [Maritimibacter fusiformis]|uniref:RTX toxin-activating lysine-acyltransferase n=1 Tax=Maritimibacter fusiformis TaxID=2603819 RepID=A0A5D0RR17_9RHOB|nr:toxin-activating lysine-acyltransferase [Maritimibacter fusiformis]TYB83021.1 toxin-activating lysine-acyltransferase [Maritimibacter fusiformis]
MSGRKAKAKGAQAAPRPKGPTDEHLLALGKLCFLAGFCPLHRGYRGSVLAGLFFPAVNHGCVRFFEDENGATAAALIWARLTDEAADRMLHDRVLPGEAEWTAGPNLWFLDLIAPFGHGRQVARHIARHPPEGAFRFARLDRDGNLRKVVLGDATRGQRGLVEAVHFVGEAA